MNPVIASHPEIDVHYAGHERDSRDRVIVSICYRGWPEDLIAAGIATAEMLGPKVKGRKRIDEDGDSFTLSRYWVLKDGQPQHYYKLYRRKPVDRLDNLPGARAAVMEYLRVNSAPRPSRDGGTAEYRRYMQERQEWADASTRELLGAIMPPALRQLIAAVQP